jgi:ribosomal protein L7/L12
MNLMNWLRSLFSPNKALDEIDDRPLSSTPLPSRKISKNKNTSTKVYVPKQKNTYDLLVDGMVAFLNRPENAEFKQEILQDTQNFDAHFAAKKLREAMQKAKVMPSAQYHPGDYGDALHDAIYEFKKAGETLPTKTASDEAQMDVILEAIGDRKVGVVNQLKQLTQLPLKQIMELVDGQLPATIFKAVPESKARTIQKALLETGAQVSVTSIKTSE